VSVLLTHLLLLLLLLLYHVDSTINIIPIIIKPAFATAGTLRNDAVLLFVRLIVCHTKPVHKNAVFSKTKQFRAMVSTDVMGFSTATFFYYMQFSTKPFLDPYDYLIDSKLAPCSTANLCENLYLPSEIFASGGGLPVAPINTTRHSVCMCIML